ncbi:hypothetical protein SDC9_99034 [bioreactor metagenome]|uniref:YggT family protein n=1 Tax=bioreactor metagenome TaxID=1076179 RepID=A0A645AGE9_9ZZZZ
MLGNLISTVIEVFKYMVLIRLFANLFMQGSQPRWLQILEEYTEPVLAPFRRLIPPIMMGGAYLDFSPVLLFIGLGFLQTFIRILL